MKSMGRICKEGKRNHRHSIAKIGNVTIYVVNILKVVSTSLFIHLDSMVAREKQFVSIINQKISYCANA